MVTFPTQKGITMLHRRITALFAALVAAVVLSSCAMPSTATDEVALQVGSGFTEGKPVKDCIPVGTREVKFGDSWGDEFFYYPANQRTFDFTGKEGSDAAPISVVSKDNQPVTIPGQINFTLNTECETLTEFHNLIGRRYQAYMNSGSEFVVVDQETGLTGWQRMLNLFIARAADATLDRVAKQYTWRELYSDPSIKDEMNRQVNDTIADLVNQQTEGKSEFFLNFTALLNQPLPDEQLVQALKDEQSTVAKAQAEQAKAVAEAEAAKAAADAQIAQKNSEVLVAQLEAQRKAAEIAAYGGPENYINFKAIEKGLNPLQPVYGGGTLVQAP